MDVLREKGLVYGRRARAAEEALDPHDEWEPVELTLFRSSRFGDDRTRPMKKSDGSLDPISEPTAAYPFPKATGRRPSRQHLGRRDHAGTVKRVQAASEGVDRRPGRLDVKLIQMVRLFRRANR
jgi:arginyl-tRNA synthetase